MDTTPSSFKNKTVIVTGGAGFIGSHLCEELVQLGANVISVDDYSAGKSQNLQHLIGLHNFQALKIDVCDESAIDEIFPGVDTVFHNAASKKSICLLNPRRDLEVNAAGTLNLLNAAHKHKTRKFVHASTGSVYGEPSIFPTTEQHPLRPVSYYGVSKLAGERYVDVFHRLYGLNTTILRYFHVYGPRQESNEFGGVVSIFVRNILENKKLTLSGDGTQVRSFTWVKDLVQANILSALNPVSNGKVYNAASGISVSINELAINLVKMMNASDKIAIEHGEPLLGDIMNFDISNESICQDLEIKFQKDFWGTMKMTINDFVEYFNKLNSCAESV